MCVPTFCPLNWNFHINRPKRPRCPWDVPNLSLGRFQNIPTTKFLYVIFLYRLFSGCRKRSAAKGVRSLFFVFGTLSVTFRSLFLMLLSLFSSLFCQTPFAGLLLRQGDFFSVPRKFGANFGANFGTKTRKVRGAFVLQL